MIFLHNFIQHLQRYKKNILTRFLTSSNYSNNEGIIFCLMLNAFGILFIWSDYKSAYQFKNFTLNGNQKKKPTKMYNQS